jgi:predicted amidophosphoribosyltransferase
MHNRPYITICQTCGKPAPLAIDICWNCGRELHSTTIQLVPSGDYQPVSRKPIKASVTYFDIDYAPV